MRQPPFPVIDPVATGQNILRLRKERGITVKDLQAWFNFEEPRAIYKWQRGQSLPNIDNLYALSAILNVPMDRIIVGAFPSAEPQAAACGPALFRAFLIPRRGIFPIMPFTLGAIYAIMTGQAGGLTPSAL